MQLRCSHEGGFQPWPADNPASFPVIMLQHAKYLQYDAANRVRVADVWESGEWAVAPKLPATGANIRRVHSPTECTSAILTFALRSTGSSLSAGLAEAALQAAQWAEASAPLLLALRVSAY